MDENGWKWIEKAESGCKCLGMTGQGVHCLNYLDLAVNGYEWFELAGRK